MTRDEFLRDWRPRVPSRTHVELLPAAVDALIDAVRAEAIEAATRQFDGPGGELVRRKITAAIREGGR